MGFQRNEEGKVIDPPTIPEYEARINAAMAAADVPLTQVLHKEYHEAREELVTKLENQEKESDREFEERQAKEKADRDSAREGSTNE